MKKTITIGIPRALLYYRYNILWKTFLEKLGLKVVISPETTKNILEEGINYSIDESCLSSKVFMGHISYLRGKTDYIFIPRIASYGKDDITCTKFHGLFDIVKNTFPDINLIEYDLDVNNGKTEFIGFMKLGLNFTKNIFKIYMAYRTAKKSQAEYERHENMKQQELLKKQGLKILVVSHSYNIYDEFIGQPVIKYLNKLKVIPLFADLADREYSKNAAMRFSYSLYWTYNKELIGSIDYYKEKIDGIIFLVSFPCGPDSLVTEICQRKIKDIPFITIVMDELQGEAGLRTRLESFIDIISMKKQEEKII
ncbi:hypothetical protein OXPF_30190 [Oxobacter pfennigii]|uniref:DUF2229 domain-containing protein n=1 Tax=Oxobacter pfennigii TaxID=36849 RepID=A0A0P8W6E9_9CLOT|nr:acyl-CoA dehydratase activase-related protein [Oxobacter pfennigii]KPU43578.1 hypothetical protein OXPF_30190 [Oxobacter pfennigii]